MRVIITGGTGLIGSALAQSLAADGHDVILLSRNPDRAAHRLRPGIRAERWDTRTAAGWGHLADGADAIVNLAGENLAGRSPFIDRWTPARKQLILSSRLAAGQAVVEAVRAARQKPGVVLQASAVGYYGPSGDTILREDMPPGDDFQGRLCPAWEASTRPVAEMGVRHVVARTGLPLSTRGGFLPPLLVPFRLFAGGPFGSGRQYWPWIHMDDEVAALRFLLESGASGAFNLCAPAPATNREFARALGRVLRRPAILPLPAPILRLMTGEIADGLLLSSWRQVPERLQQLGFEFKHPALEPALRDVLQRRV